MKGWARFTGSPRFNRLSLSPSTPDLASVSGNAFWEDARTATFSATLGAVTTRTGSQLPLLLTSGAYSNATGTVVTTGGGVSGTLAVTLDALTVTSAGSVAVTGTLSQTLAALTASAAGTVAVQGTAGITLASVTVSAAGNVAVKGTLAVTMDPLTSSAVGAVAVKGSLAVTLADVTAAATGTVSNGPVGSASILLDDLTAAATGTVTGVGTAPIVENSGWSFPLLAHYDRLQRRKREQARKLAELEESTANIEDDVARQIAQLLREQERKDAERANFERLKALARRYGDASQLDSERARQALLQVQAKASRAALEKLDRELARMRDEEEFVVMLLLAADD